MRQKVSLTEAPHHASEKPLPSLVPPLNEFRSVDKTHIAHSVEHERIIQFFLRDRATALANLVPSIYTVWSLSGDVALERLIAWCLVVNLFSIAAIFNAHLFRRSMTPEALNGIWNRDPELHGIRGRFFAIQVSLRASSSITWGSLALIAPLPHSDALAAQLGSILVAVSTVSAIGLIPLGSINYALTALLWILPFNTLLLSNSARMQSYSVGLFVLMGSLWFFLKRASEQHVEGIEKRFEAAALAENLRSAADKIQELATYDELTRTFNRNLGMGALERLCERHRMRGTNRLENSFVLMLDIDHFKRINDTLGHAGGDAVLRGFADVLRSNIRPHDVLARIGGEEFLIILPDIDFIAVRERAEELRQRIAEYPMLLDGHIEHITTSIGAARIDAESTVENVLHRADSALYSAKNSGRNAIVFADCELKCFGNHDTNSRTGSCTDDAITERTLRAKRFPARAKIGNEVAQPIKRAAI